MSGFDDLAFPVLVGALFTSVFVRAQVTYWLGRAVTASSVRLGHGGAGSGGGARAVAAVDRWTRGARGRRAIELMQRWGPLAVTLSFFTVGVQTAINATAGLTRMRYGRYTAAMVPGCVAWALIYSTVGLAAFYGAVALAARSPWALATAVVLVVAVVVTASARRRRRAGRSVQAEPAPAPAEGPR